jgi:hypothetical protein
MTGQHGQHSTAPTTELPGAAHDFNSTLRAPSILRIHGIQISPTVSANGGKTESLDVPPERRAFTSFSASTSLHGTRSDLDPILKTKYPIH